MNISLIYTYISCIKSGKLKLEDVPERYRDDVKRYLEEQNANS